MMLMRDICRCNMRKKGIVDEDIPNAFIAKVEDKDNVCLSAGKPLLWNFTTLYLD